MRVIIFVAILVLSLNNVLADSITENQQLARINAVLNSIYPLINQAKEAADVNARVKFHYEWLQKDIQSIQAGIAEKINHAPIEPRAISSLKTHYTKTQDIERGA